MSYEGIIRRWREFLPCAEESIISLCEGNTPLLPSRRLARELGFKGRLYYKLEGLNPTGSFKDRGMTYAVSKAVEAGARATICASTGNTSAAAAAYSARAGLRSVVMIPKGKIAMGKLAQALIHGSTVVSIDGNFDDALKIVREISLSGEAVLVNSVNPHRLEGQKTAAYEICEQFGGHAPTHHILPVGNAGNITAYWRGYQTFQRLKRIKNLPKMIGFQAAGAAPIVKGHVVKKPETVASAIRIGNPATWEGALQARDESGGLIDSVTDREILRAYQSVAQYDGYFCEPSSAASIAGFIKLLKKDSFRKNKNAVVVCTLTGHGLKDPDTAIKVSPKFLEMKPNVNLIRKALGL